MLPHAGRVVFLRSIHGVPEPAVVLRTASASSPSLGSGRTLLRQPGGDDHGNKQLYVLALHRGTGLEAQVEPSSPAVTMQKETLKASTVGMGVRALAIHNPVQGCRRCDSESVGFLLERHGVGSIAEISPHGTSHGEVRTTIWF